MSDINLKGIIEYQDGSQTVVDDRTINFRNLSVMVGVGRPLKKDKK